MSGVTLATHEPAETRSVGAALAGLLEPGDVVLLAGDLGSGKTELAKGIAAGLGIDEPVVSPTFTLVRQYDGRLPLVHVDVYRLERAREVLDLGLEDLAGDDGVIVVEWGDVTAALVRGDHLEVRLDMVDGDDDRLVTITPLGRSWLARSSALAAALSG